MKKIYVLVIAFSFISLPSHSHAQTPSLEIRHIVNAIVTEASERYLVGPDFLWQTLWCESRFNFAAVGDGGTSFGISQIHLPAHPEISATQALNAAFSIDFMAREMSIGNAWKWSCFKKIFGSNYDISLRWEKP